MKLASSNQKKLKEYQEMFPSITAISIEDQKEIVADKDLVMFYKVKNINMPNVIVEDTILEVNENGIWKEIIDIKYRVKDLKDEKEARWLVTLGIMKDGIINLYRGAISGIIKPNNYVDHTFGFDSIFYPAGEVLSLDQFNQQGLKAKHSARRLAMEQLLKDNLHDSRKVSDLPDWTGTYQS